MSAIVCSAALVMLEVGALTTMTPALVAASTSTLSRPTPARATTRRLRRVRERLGVHLGGAADDERVRLRQGGQQRGPVGSVGVADLEVGAEHGETRFGKLLCDEYDGLVHEWILRCVRLHGHADESSRAHVKALTSVRNARL